MEMKEETLMFLTAYAGLILILFCGAWLLLGYSDNASARLWENTIREFKITTPEWVKSPLREVTKWLMVIEAIVGIIAGIILILVGRGMVMLRYKYFDY